MEIRTPTTNEIRGLLQQAEKGDVDPHRLRWLARLIDHTLLKPGVTDEFHSQLCREAKEHHFATVCVYPAKVALCRELLKGTDTKAIAVVGFPTGRNRILDKIKETKDAVAAGAQEIDMVLNVEKLRERQMRHVYLDIRKVVLAARPVPVKVILETCLLTEEEKIMACGLAKAAGAAFVKTSTGFSTGGATEHDVALMRKAVGEEMGVKASGGVRCLADALRMILAGANRIGTSNGVAIVSGKSPKSHESGVY
jgi:deoxyribose-phosphate aldolase